ncbi:helix-turn-helix domain-containing protein [Thermodesulfobacteriota bacterium]
MYRYHCGTSIRKPKGLENEAHDALSDAVFPEGLVLDLTTEDFDKMASIAPKWDQEYLQFGKGRFKGHLLGIHTNRIQIGKVTWDPGILVRGSTPPRSITLAMLLHRSGAASCQGLPLEESHIMVLEPGQEFEITLQGKSTLLVVAVAEELFWSHAHALWGEPFVLTDSRDRLVVCQTPTPEAVREEWAKRVTDIACDGTLLTKFSLAQSLEKDILEQILRNARGPRPCPPGAYRRQAAKRAEEYLITNAKKPVSLADLCTAAKANERTLLLGFHEVFGMPPKQYLKSLRLNRVRQDLLRASHDTTVTDVATHWGFTHLSRFAADYREMFGALPHETLKNRWKSE